LAGRLAERLCAIAFGELDMHRVEATCDPRNTASARVLLRLGMMREGTLRHMMKLTDGWRDSDIYSLLRPDWESRRADN
jgi:RimJ/RimL family protein N-acetyltransferase